MARSRVYVLYTGGTFGMQPDPTMPGNPLVPMSAEQIRGFLPDSRAIAKGADVDVFFESAERLIDSSSMTPVDWISIGRRIHDNYHRFDGFVVIQGTDTLAYTSSALSFMFENLGKPIVITGSQLPLVSSRTDAALNYLHALTVAAYKATGLPRIPEVVVVFADKILRGCRTRKMSASAWTGFDSPNARPLGEIGEHVRIFENEIRPSPASDLEVQFNTELVSEVLDISLYPGLRAEHLREILSLSSVRGVVLRTYGAGNAPEDYHFLEALSDGIRREDKTVVNVTQCPQGTVEMGLYAASVGLLDIGVISGLDMTPEAALTKLMVILGTRIGDQIKLQMQISQRGEQSQNLFDLVYKARRSKESADSYAEYAFPDRRFDRNDLRVAVLRIRDLKIQLADNTDGESAIFVFMNAPNAAVKDIIRTELKRSPGSETGTEVEFGHPRLICTINLKQKALQHPFAVVEALDNEKVKNIIGDNEITLNLVPTAGVSFSFEKLSLSLFTKA